MSQCGLMSLLKGDTNRYLRILKDIMNFLNACMVAKTCRDGRQILAFPENMYAEVYKIAKETDGHRLLRVMEIFTEVEMKLKYATSPRVLFETAVLKASMPQEDYDIESLLSRIASLEKAVAEGVIVKNEAPMSALTKEMRDKIRAYTKTIYKRMNLTGVVRMDFLVSQGKVYLSEINTVPGSLAYYLFCERISDARVFFGELIEEAIEGVEEKLIPVTNLLYKK